MYAKGTIDGEGVAAPDRPGEKLSLGKRQDLLLLDLVASGRSWRAIGACLGVAHTTTARWFDVVPQWVIALRKRREPLVPEPMGWLPPEAWRYEAMRRLVRLGYTTREVGLMLNVHQSTVARRLGPRRRARAS